MTAKIIPFPQTVEMYEIDDDDIEYPTCLAIAITGEIDPTEALEVIALLTKCLTPSLQEFAENHDLRLDFHPESTAISLKVESAKALKPDLFPRWR